ncbi:MAG: fatty acid desaturase [Cyanobacteria bacterium J06648_16]
MFSSIVKIPLPLGSGGFFIALIIIGGWIAHLRLLLSTDLVALSPALLFGAVLLQTFLNTGLFITAHEAIHGLACPENFIVNTLLGRFCAIAYAALPYKSLAVNHLNHHRYPMSAADPDFHSLEETRENANFLVWYSHFIGQYWNGKQFVQLASAIGIVLFLFRIPFLKILLLWGLPLFLSSLQLFCFGTYLPHRGTQRSCADSLEAANASHALPWLLSLITCYHFGYHQEHHARPDIPWWGLPALYEVPTANRISGDRE